MWKYAASRNRPNANLNFENLNFALTTACPRQQRVDFVLFYTPRSPRASVKREDEEGERVKQQQFSLQWWFR
jgi:hypothetical protein